MAENHTNDSVPSDDEQDANPIAEDSNDRKRPSIKVNLFGVEIANLEPISTILGLLIGGSLIVASLISRTPAGVAEALAREMIDEAIETAQAENEARLSDVMNSVETKTAEIATEQWIAADEVARTTAEAANATSVAASATARALGSESPDVLLLHNEVPVKPSVQEYLLEPGVTYIGKIDDPQLNRRYEWDYVSLSDIPITITHAANGITATLEIPQMTENDIGVITVCQLRGTRCPDFGQRVEKYRIVVDTSLSPDFAQQ